MFDFFLKKKKITLDCYTSSPHVYDYAPISNAINHIPDWWRNTPKKVTISNDLELKLKQEAGVNDTSSATVKNCPAIINYYKKGIVIPSWFELKLEIQGNMDKTYSWRSSSELKLNSHYPSQYEGFSKSDGELIKIESPWRFKTSKKIYFLWSHPIWHTRETMFNLLAPPAVIDYYTQHGTHINIFFRYTEEKQNIQILPITPLVIIHPLSDYEIKIVNHLVTEKEIERIDGKYKLRLRNKADDIVESIKKINYIQKKIKDTNPCPHFPKGETK